MINNSPYFNLSLYNLQIHISTKVVTFSTEWFHFAVAVRFLTTGLRPNRNGRTAKAISFTSKTPVTSAQHQFSPGIAKYTTSFFLSFVFVSELMSSALHYTERNSNQCRADGISFFFSFKTGNSYIFFSHLSYSLSLLDNKINSQQIF